MCPHTTIYLSIYLSIYIHTCIEIFEPYLNTFETYWDTAGAWGEWVSRCRERRELLVYALTYHQNSHYNHQQPTKKYKSKCVCVCGIEPSSLVNEGGKGLSGKEQEKNNRYMHSYVYIYIATVYMHSYVYIYIATVSIYTPSHAWKGP
jgi:hypothetical protein